MIKEIINEYDMKCVGVAVSMAQFSTPDGRIKTLSMYAGPLTDQLYYRIVNYEGGVVEVPSIASAINVYNKCRP